MPRDVLVCRYPLHHIIMHHLVSCDFSTCHVHFHILHNLTSEVLHSVVFIFPFRGTARAKKPKCLFSQIQYASHRFKENVPHIYSPQMCHFARNLVISFFPCWTSTLKTATTCHTKFHKFAMLWPSLCTNALNIFMLRISIVRARASCICNRKLAILHCWWVRSVVVSQRQESLSWRKSTGERIRGGAGTQVAREDAHIPNHTHPSFPCALSTLLTAWQDVASHECAVRLCFVIRVRSPSPFLKINFCYLPYSRGKMNVSYVPQYHF